MLKFQYASNIVEMELQVFIVVIIKWLWVLLMMDVTIFVKFRMGFNVMLALQEVFVHIIKHFL